MIIDLWFIYFQQVIYNKMIECVGYREYFDQLIINTYTELYVNVNNNNNDVCSRTLVFVYVFIFDHYFVYNE